MKANIKLVLLASILILSTKLLAQTNSNPWKQSQLMEPFTLSKMVADSSAEKVYVYNIGPVEDIKGAIHIGPVQDAMNLTKLKSELEKLSKDAKVVIYCGCCPFHHCPNVRPAFELLNNMGFKNHYLLNLADNLKIDWIDKGYPLK